MDTRKQVGNSSVTFSHLGSLEKGCVFQLDTSSHTLCTSSSAVSKALWAIELSTRSSSCDSRFTTRCLNSSSCVARQWVCCTELQTRQHYGKLRSQANMSFKN
ncbi:hypothetical protein E2C01_004267 [Portunus trituberculatus]|uniref:Uncharacterized protein n=1 Tax=Portunus trituberculatus TaxID=210409 RepID=A0A5B7CTK2_PORTR|nr:hypothetical protein [Portunus trituberculatus]